MALYINDAEVDALVSRLAELENTSKVEVVRRALKEEIDQRERRDTAEERLERLRKIGDDATARMKAAGIYRPYTKEEADEMFAYLEEEPTDTAITQVDEKHGR
jgi:hypothetical protein